MPRMARVYRTVGIYAYARVHTHCCMEGLRNTLTMPTVILFTLVHYSGISGEAIRCAAIACVISRLIYRVGLEHRCAYSLACLRTRRALYFSFEKIELINVGFNGRPSESTDITIREKWVSLWLETVTLVPRDESRKSFQRVFRAISEKWKRGKERKRRNGFQPPTKFPRRSLTKKRNGLNGFGKSSVVNLRLVRSGK